MVILHDKKCTKTLTDLGYPEFDTTVENTDDGEDGDDFSDDDLSGLFEDDKTDDTLVSFDIPTENISGKKRQQRPKEKKDEEAQEKPPRKKKRLSKRTSVADDLSKKITDNNLADGIVSNMYKSKLIGSYGLKATMLDNPCNLVDEAYQARKLNEDNVTAIMESYLQTESGNLVRSPLKVAVYHREDTNLSYEAFLSICQKLHTMVSG